MERCFSRAQEFDEIVKLRVTTGIATATDRDAVEVTGFCLEGGKGLVRDCPEILEPGIFFPDPFCAVVAAFLKRQAVRGSRMRGSFSLS